VKRLQTPVVNPHHIGVAAYIRQFLGRMHLQQNLQAQFMSQFAQVVGLIGRQDGRNQQDGISTQQLRLVHLVGIDDEILAEQGHVHQRARQF